MTDYFTYWTISETSSQTVTSVKVALIFAVVCLTLSFVLFKFKGRLNYDNKLIVAWGLLIMGFISSGMYVFLLTMPNEGKQDINAFFENRQACGIVEGTITDFKIEYDNTRGGQRTTESFIVDTLKFIYDDYPMSSFNSFDKTRLNGGILDNNLIVRITYIKDSNKIVKLEIKE